MSTNMLEQDVEMLRIGLRHTTPTKDERKSSMAYVDAPALRRVLAALSAEGRERELREQDLRRILPIAAKAYRDGDNSDLREACRDIADYASRTLDTLASPAPPEDAEPDAARLPRYRQNGTRMEPHRYGTWTPLEDARRAVAEASRVDAEPYAWAIERYREDGGWIRLDLRKTDPREALPPGPLPEDTRIRPLYTLDGDDR